MTIQWASISKDPLLSARRCCRSLHLMLSLSWCHQVRIAGGIITAFLHGASSISFALPAPSRSYSASQACTELTIVDALQCPA